MPIGRVQGQFLRPWRDLFGPSKELPALQVALTGLIESEVTLRHLSHDQYDLSQAKFIKTIPRYSLKILVDVGRVRSVALASSERSQCLCHSAWNL